MKKTISLNDQNYFELGIGDRVLDKDLVNSKGNVPLFSGSVTIPRGFVNESILDDFEHDYVIWGIDDAVFDFSVIPKGRRFSITDHCGAIKILNKDIVADYLLFQLQLQKYELGFGWEYRASLTWMKKASVNIPIKPDGSFDVEEQNELVKKYKLLKERKQELKSDIDELAESIIEIDHVATHVEKPLSDIFNFLETNSGMTRKLCNKNTGNIPVYGCSKSENAVLGYIKENQKGIKYYKDCLTWNRNGSVGHIFLRKDVFSTNEDHRVMEIKPELKESLYLPYFKFVIINEIRKLGYDFSTKLGKSRMEVINVKIPIKPDGQFDLDKQKEIAQKYEKAYKIKENTIQSLQELNKIVVSI